MADAADRSAQLQEESMQRAMAARPSAEVFVECDEPIPARRRELLPGVQRCMFCQSVEERRR